jgi:hypothetical protein
MLQQATDGLGNEQEQVEAETMIAVLKKHIFELVEEDEKIVFQTYKSSQIGANSIKMFFDKTKETIFRPLNQTVSSILKYYEDLNKYIFFGFGIATGLQIF